MTSKSYAQDFETFTANGGGRPDWLMPIRREAIDRFQTIGFPDRKNEDWKFTNVGPITQKPFGRLPAPAALPSMAAPEEFLIGESWPRLVFVNGRYAEGLSSKAGMPAGMTVETLADAWEAAPDFVTRHLTKAASVEGSGFTALNTAFMADGLFLHVAPNTKAEQPIHLLYVTDASVGPGISYPRNLIVLEQHAQAAVVESYVSLNDGEYFTNTVTEVSIEAGARLDHYKIQRESEQAYHVGTLEARQERDSHLESLSFAFGASMSRSNIYTVLDGEGSHATMNGLYVVHGEQHVDHQDGRDEVLPQ